MITCEHFTEQVADLLDGRVPHGRRIGLMMHSVLCVHCRRYMAQMRDVITLVREAAPADPPEPPLDEERAQALLLAFRAKQT